MASVSCTEFRTSATTPLAAAIESAPACEPACSRLTPLVSLAVLATAASTGTSSFVTPSQSRVSVQPGVALSVATQRPEVLRRRHQIRLCLPESVSEVGSDSGDIGKPRLAPCQADLQPTQGGIHFGKFDQRVIGAAKARRDVVGAAAQPVLI